MIFARVLLFVGVLLGVCQSAVFAQTTTYTLTDLATFINYAAPYEVPTTSNGAISNNFYENGAMLTVNGSILTFVITDIFGLFTYATGAACTIAPSVVSTYTFNTADVSDVVPVTKISGGVVTQWALDFTAKGNKKMINQKESSPAATCPIPGNHPGVESQNPTYTFQLRVMDGDVANRIAAMVKSAW